MRDDSQYIHDLTAQGEHRQQDFKYEITDAGKLARSVSAFANTVGGRLLIGVRDDGTIAGVKTEEEIYMMTRAAYGCCEPEADIKFKTIMSMGAMWWLLPFRPPLPSRCAPSTTRATRPPICASRMRMWWRRP